MLPAMSDSTWPAVNTPCAHVQAMNRRGLDFLEHLRAELSNGRVVAGSSSARPANPIKDVAQFTRRLDPAHALVLR